MREPKRLRFEASARSAAPSSAPPSPLMSREECAAVYDRIAKLTGGRGWLTVMLSSVWRGNVRWTNNDVISSGDTTDHSVAIMWDSYATCTTNQFDEASLEHALHRLAEARRIGGIQTHDLIGPQQYANAEVFFESTANLLAAERSAVGKRLAEPMNATGLRSAGYLEVLTGAYAVFNSQRLAAYGQSSTAQYSVTVRNPSDTGSGWAGVDQNDWTKIDAAALTERARKKCVASADPRAVEPGRYVAILEPQAVHDLMEGAVSGIALDRQLAEIEAGPYHLTDDQSKLGRRVFDPRISITSDPMDPLCSTLPFVPDGWYAGEPVHRTSWITDGILTKLGYDRRYARSQLITAEALPLPRSYHMSGGTTSIDEMIASTERGVLVTRFSHVRLVDPISLLLTGVTRDGLWLVERGKVTYAIKNFRFNESPFFVFNAVEQLGVPTRVFSPGRPAVVPPVKVRDFNFTSLADAV